MIRPEAWKGTCKACEKEVTFKTGFACDKLPGNHILESVRFYHMGGRDIQHPREKRGWAPKLIYTRPKTRDTLTGNVIEPMPLAVQFNQGGLLDTDDSEVQFWLQTRSGSVGWGEDGRKTWERIYLSTDQQVAIAENRLAALNEQIKDKNTLLEDTKARTAGGRGRPVGATA